MNLETIDFNNTQIAFASKSDKELRRAERLFKLVSKAWMVSLGKKLVNFALFIKFPLRPFVKPNIFKQFCGGETIKECEKTIRELDQYKIGTILDYSVEGNDDERSQDLMAEKIIQTIKRAKDDVAIPFAVFKFSGVARFSLLEKLGKKNAKLNDKDEAERKRFLERIENICQVAYDSDVPVLIDAEESWIQDTIDEVVWEMMLKFNKKSAIVFNTIQTYRKDRLEYLKTIHENVLEKKIFCGIKLVRGAYMEKERIRAQKKGLPSPIHDTKSDSDKCFNDCMGYIMNNLEVFSLCAGTHNEESSQLLIKLMLEKNIHKSDKRVYFSQLLGMSDHISYNLSNAGYNVAKYVPFGHVREVVPYLIRRAEENTSAAGQTGRELRLIKSELERRKSK